MLLTRRAVILLSFVAVFALVLALPASAGNLSIAMRPGDTARLPLKLWCIDYGKPFPKTITVPGDRADDETYAVLMAALAKGTTSTEPYQTELAIWRPATGKFNDYNKVGDITLAQEIYSDSLKLTVPPVPAGALTLDQAVKDGTIKVTIENFVSIPDPGGASGSHYFGTADLVIENVSSQSINVLYVEGSVFFPAGNDQRLMSHLDPDKTAELPQTGGAGGIELLPGVVALAGAALLSAGAWLGRRKRE